MRVVPLEKKYPFASGIRRGTILLYSANLSTAVVPPTTAFPPLTRSCPTCFMLPPTIHSSFKGKGGTCPRLGQTDQIDRYLNHLIPRLPLRKVVQDLHSTDRCNPGNMVLDYADFLAPAQQHELGHARSGIDLPCVERSRSSGGKRGPVQGVNLSTAHPRVSG